MSAGSGALAAPLGDGRVRRGVLVDLPVQADGALVLQLQPVHAEVARARVRVLGVGQPEVQEHPAVVRPRLHAREQVDQIDVRALEHDLLAGRTFDVPGRDGAQLGGLAQGVLEPADAARQFRLEQRAEPRPDLVQVVDAEGARHPPRRAERVDQQRHPAAGRVLEQQRRAVFAQHPLDDPGHLQVRIDGRGHPGQVAVALQRGHEVLQIGERHANKYRVCLRGLPRKELYRVS